MNGHELKPEQMEIAECGEKMKANYQYTYYKAGISDLDNNSIY
jgi:hypothetical protein